MATTNQTTTLPVVVPARTKRVWNKYRGAIPDGVLFKIGGSDIVMNNCRYELSRHGFIHNGTFYKSPTALCKAHSRAHGAKGNSGHQYEYIVRMSDGKTLAEVIIERRNYR
jgi:hypothetical protein